MSYKSFLKVTDLPQDRLQVLGKLRTVLVGTFNKCRERKYKMALLKEVIKFMHTKIVEWEKETIKREEAEAVKAEAIAAELAEKEAATKARKDILDEATKLDIDLDERKTTEKLAEELAEAIKAKGTK